MNAPTVQNEDVLPQIIDNNDKISFLELLQTLWFRRRLLFSTALFIIAVGVIMMYQMVPRYTASSIMLIAVPKTKVVDIEEVMNAGSSDAAAIFSEMAVLRSKVLARKVIEKFNLRSKEEFNPRLRPPGLLSHIRPSQWIPDQLKDRLKEILGSEPAAAALSEDERDRLEIVGATNIFLGKLNISQQRNSSVITVSFESTDPKLAAAIANELPESYIIGKMEAKLDATRKATKWLDEQLSELKENLKKSEHAVEIFRSSHDLTEIQGNRILVSQLSEINSQLISARAERVQLELRLQQLKKLQNMSNSEIESTKEVMSSGVIQRLRGEESSLTRKASELSVQYLPKHHKIKKLDAQLKNIREKIDLEIKRIVVGQENELEVARSKEQSLSLSLKELEKKSGEQSKEAVQLHTLEREASANRVLFETFLTRFKETSTTAGIVEAGARVISKADIPGGASSPNKRIVLTEIFAGAFITAIILVFLVQALHQGLLSPEQIEKELDLNTIGVIPNIPGNINPYDYLLDKPNSHFSEALNMLKTSLIMSSFDEPVKVLQITSSVPKEGKSTLAIAFARYLAMSGNTVILVDGDFRRASLAKKLDISASGKGLTDLLMTSDSPLKEFVIKDKKSGVLIMLKGGGKYVNATELFSSHRMQEIIGSLKKKFDYVIIDAPPVMATADPRFIARLVDKTVFVVQWNKTPRKVVKVALSILKDDGANIAGCVLQKVNLERSSYGRGDSGYYYNYGEYYTN